MLSRCSFVSDSLKLAANCIDAPFRAPRTAVPGRPIDPFFQLFQSRSLRYFFAVVNFDAHRVLCCALQHGLDTPQYRSFPQLNLHRARNYTEVIYVGEPTGENVNFYGDPAGITPLGPTIRVYGDRDLSIDEGIRSTHFSLDNKTLLI